MSKSVGGIGCGCLTFVLLFNLTIGGISVNYLSNQLFSKDLPWWADGIIGLFAGEVSVPAAIIVWILRICGVDVHLN